MKKNDLDDLAQEIGARFERAIMESDFGDVKRFADAIGRSRDAIYKMCRGQSLAQYVQLVMMARALKLTPNDLLGFNSTEASSGLVDGLVGAFESAMKIPETQARLLVQTVLEEIRVPTTHSADPASLYRDRGALVVRRLLNSKSP